MQEDGIVKAFFFKHPRITQSIRVAKASVGRFRKTVHDPDFYALNILQQQAGLALDIGGNVGQSAVAILSIKPSFRVISIEPNPACHFVLSVLSKLYPGDKLQAIHAGAGEQPSELTLSIPVRNGRELLGEATFDIGTFSEPVTIGRIGHLGIDYTLAEKICPAVKIDDLDKSPAFVKIDVQGLEPEVLRGMSATIRKSMPLIMIERSSDEGECAGFLSEFGYVKR